jgi:hypothetical protein
VTDSREDFKKNVKGQQSDTMLLLKTTSRRFVTNNRDTKKIYKCSKMMLQIKKAS